MCDTEQNCKECTNLPLARISRMHVSWGVSENIRSVGWRKWACFLWGSGKTLCVCDHIRAFTQLPNQWIMALTMYPRVCILYIYIYYRQMYRLTEWIIMVHTHIKYIKIHAFSLHQSLLLKFRLGCFANSGLVPVQVVGLLHMHCTEALPREHGRVEAGP